MSNYIEAESEILRSILPRYEAEGFEVYIHPSPSILPTFMQSYRPDAIALSKDKKIAIEVVHAKRESSSKLKELESLFASHRDWEFQVFYVSPSDSQDSLAVVSASEIERALERVKSLLDSGHYIPALIMCWGTLEALGRALLPEHFRRTQTPSRLVEVLANEGSLTPQEADFLRSTISLRNGAVHGQIGVEIDKRKIEEFTAVLRTLLNLLSKRTASKA